MVGNLLRGMHGLYRHRGICSHLPGGGLFTCAYGVYACIYEKQFIGREMVRKGLVKRAVNKVYRVGDSTYKKKTSQGESPPSGMISVTVTGPE